MIVLVDGSKERALEEMLGPPIQFGKLCDRLRLDPSISTGIWREALPGRFQQAGLELQHDALDAILAFGQEHPYPTMTAARYSALNARKLGSETVGRFEAEEGVAEAKRHLEEDA